MHAIQALATQVVNKFILIYAFQQQSANNSSSSEQTTAFKACSVQPWITSISLLRKSGASSAPFHCAFLRRHSQSGGCSSLAYLLTSSSCKVSPTRCEKKLRAAACKRLPKGEGEGSPPRRRVRKAASSRLSHLTPWLHPSLLESVSVPDVNQSR